VDAAHAYADENELYERFDDFMEVQGLRPRTRDWAVEVEATVRARVTGDGPQRRRGGGGG
jgi:hypothetical protein